jgi:hypothetical protein
MAIFVPHHPHDLLPVPFNTVFCKACSAVHKCRVQLCPARCLDLCPIHKTAFVPHEKSLFYPHLSDVDTGCVHCTFGTSETKLNRALTRSNSRALRAAPAHKDIVFCVYCWTQATKKCDHLASCREHSCLYLRSGVDINDKWWLRPSDFQCHFCPTTGVMRQKAQEWSKALSKGPDDDYFTPGWIRWKGAFQTAIQEYHPGGFTSVEDRAKWVAFIDDMEPYPMLMLRYLAYTGDQIVTRTYSETGTMPGSVGRPMVAPPPYSPPGQSHPLLAIEEAPSSSSNCRREPTRSSPAVPPPVPTAEVAAPVPSQMHLPQAQYMIYPANTYPRGQIPGTYPPGPFNPMSSPQIVPTMMSRAMRPMSPNIGPVAMAPISPAIGPVAMSLGQIPSPAPMRAGRNSRLFNPQEVPLPAQSQIRTSYADRQIARTGQHQTMHSSRSQADLVGQMGGLEISDVRRPQYRGSSAQYPPLGGGYPAPGAYPPPGGQLPFGHQYQPSEAVYPTGARHQYNLSSAPDPIVGSIPHCSQSAPPPPVPQFPQPLILHRQPSRVPQQTQPSPHVNFASQHNLPIPLSTATGPPTHYPPTTLSRLSRRRARSPPEINPSMQRYTAQLRAQRFPHGQTPGELPMGHPADDDWETVSEVSTRGSVAREPVVAVWTPGVREPVRRVGNEPLGPIWVPGGREPSRRIRHPNQPWMELN